MSASPRRFRHTRAPSASHNRAADIAYLLDPAFSGVAAPSHGSPPSFHVYVDEQGEIHDPDFRLFPPAPTPKHLQSHPHPHVPKKKRGMGRSWAEEEDGVDSYDEDDDENYARFDQSRSYRRSVDSDRGSLATWQWQVQPGQRLDQRHLSSSPTSMNTHSSQSASYPSPPPPSPVRDASASYIASSPDTHVMGFDVRSLLSGSEDDEHDLDSRRIKEKPKRLRKHPAAPAAWSDPEKRDDLRQDTPQSPPCPADARPAGNDDDQEAVLARDEWVPTCTEAIRKQWQSVALSVRFGVFRTKRRLREKLGFT